ncbi:hypothetical protein C8J56DRAFT_1077740 [Mycena floridula]|nr:hypothetical protein C8J56DRAFT_1077740 [Mycena floridula]
MSSMGFIQNNTVYHSQLLTSISELDYASVALAQQRQGATGPEIPDTRSRGGGSPPLAEKNFCTYFSVAVIGGNPFGTMHVVNKFLSVLLPSLQNEQQEEGSEDDDADSDRGAQDFDELSGAVIEEIEMHLDSQVMDEPVTLEQTEPGVIVADPVNSQHYPETPPSESVVIQAETDSNMHGTPESELDAPLTRTRKRQLAVHRYECQRWFNVLIPVVKQVGSISGVFVQLLRAHRRIGDVIHIKSTREDNQKCFYVLVSLIFPNIVIPTEGGAGGSAQKGLKKINPLEQRAHNFDLANELSTTTKGLKKLTTETEKQQNEHKGLQDSVARKLAYRIMGQKDNFEAKVSKEERKLIDALEKEKRERESKEKLEQAFKEAQAVETDLEAKVQKLNKLQEEMEILYEKAFGSSTDFPRDQELQKELLSAQAVYDGIVAQRLCESQAIDLLNRADKCMDICNSKMKNALEFVSSVAELYMQPGTVWDAGSYSDMLEANHLSKARASASEAYLLVQEAQKLSSSIVNIPKFEVPELHTAPNPMGWVHDPAEMYSRSDNINTVKSAAETMRKTHIQIRNELAAAFQRAKTLGPDVKEAQEVVQQSRGDLNTFRRDTFLTLSISDQPPAYQVSNGST